MYRNFLSAMKDENVTLLRSGVYLVVGIKL